MTKVCEDVINAVAKFDLLLVECRLSAYKELTFVCAPYNGRATIHLHGDVCLRVKCSDSIKISSQNEIFGVVKVCVFHVPIIALNINEVCHGGHFINCLQRKRWDLNPRRTCTLAGFQDQCHKPLDHSSLYPSVL